MSNINDSYVGLVFVAKQGSSSFASGLGLDGYGQAMTASINTDTTMTGLIPANIAKPILYELEVDSLRVRQNLVVQQLVYQQTLAINGDLWITSYGKVKLTTLINGQF